MRPLGADLERFSARRIVRGALIASLLLIVVVLGVQAVRGHTYVEHYQYGNVPVEIDPNTGQVVPSDVQPQPQFQDEAVAHDTRVNVVRRLSDTLAVSGILLVVVAFVLGASFVGADFGGSGLSTQLLYEPRRWRMHASKTIAVAISCAAFALCVLCTVALAMFLAATINGVTAGADRAFWFGRAHDIVRGAVAAGLAGAMAYAVALAFRRTVVAVVVFLVQIPLVGYLDHSRTFIGTIGRALPYFGLHVLVLGRGHLSYPELLLGVTTSAAALAMTLAWFVGLFGAGGALFARAEVR